MIEVAENKYGKSRVRLVKVQRKAGWHDLHDWTVDVELQGDFDSCFLDGDNSKILPTDTMKNTIYSLARKSSTDCMEGFAREVVEFLLDRNPQVSAAEVSIAEKAWRHLVRGGEPHPTTFIQASGEKQTTHVKQSRESAVSITSGLQDLVLLKTADSAFEGYIQDSLTTLPPAKDRLLGTAVRANWKYSADVLAFNSSRGKVREILLTEFSSHKSKSVQHTLYAMGSAVLRDLQEVEDIELAMPNRHCLLVDLSRFGQDNPNEIFVPVDEPFGDITARLRRQG